MTTSKATRIKLYLFFLEYSKFSILSIFAMILARNYSGTILENRLTWIKWKLGTIQ